MNHLALGKSPGMGDSRPKYSQEEFDERHYSIQKQFRFAWVSWELPEHGVYRADAAESSIVSSRWAERISFSGPFGR